MLAYWMRGLTLAMEHEQSLSLKASAGPPVGGMTAANLKHKRVDELMVKSKSGRGNAAASD